MLSEKIVDIQGVIERFGDYDRQADGMVIGTIDLQAVVDALTNGKSLDIEFLSIERGGRIVESEDSLEVISKCTIEREKFSSVRDLEIPEKSAVSFGLRLRTGGVTHMRETTAALVRSLG